MAADEHGDVDAGEVREFAFKCRFCGHLETADAAAERATPAACRFCGHGVAFDPLTGIKSFVDDNWIVLADDEEAAAYVREHQIDANDVIVRHTPWADMVPEGRTPQHFKRSAEDDLSVVDTSGGVASKGDR